VHCKGLGTQQNGRQSVVKPLKALLASVGLTTHIGKLTLQKCCIPRTVLAMLSSQVLIRASLQVNWGQWEPSAEGLTGMECGTQGEGGEGECAAELADARGGGSCVQDRQDSDTGMCSGTGAIPGHVGRPKGLRPWCAELAM